MLEGLKPPTRTHGSCKVGIIANTLEAKDKEILLSAVANLADWPIKTLAKALADRGIQISDSPLYNHRAKTCACFRS
jgi:predicted HTH domain antitoxin